MSEYITDHTAFCAGANKALEGSGYSVTCVRKERATLVDRNGKAYVLLGGIEFNRKGSGNECIKAEKTRDVMIQFNHPTTNEDGSPLPLDKIRGYVLGTWLYSGEISELVEIELNAN